MTTILWLARDFRLTDNAALLASSRRGAVLPVFLLDASVRAMGAAPRWRLQQALEAFDRLWQARTGQNLTVVQGEAAEVLPALAAHIGATGIAQNDWPWAPMQAAQRALSQALTGSGIALQLYPGHLLLSPARIVQTRGSAYRVYTPFARMVRKLGVDTAVAAPGIITALPSQGALQDLSPLAPDMHRGTSVLQRYAAPAGEIAAQSRLDDFLADPGGYEELRDFPDQNIGSGLSEHLALGEISPRWIWARAQDSAAQQPQHRAAIDKFLSEVLWREFAWHLLLDNPQMERQAWRQDWQNFPWKGDSPAVDTWRRAETGVGLVDAGLREMRVTGRMHNRVRMVVASWLTKHLLSDWRLGLQHFADSLTDWDPASNAMNWQWVAGCGPDASPFFRIFNPLRQAAQFDAKGRYQDMWLGNGPEAMAYHATVPPAWQISSHWQPKVTEEFLKRGRDAALQALADHRTGPNTKPAWDLFA